jgi:hypothetical protein
MWQNSLLKVLFCLQLLKGGKNEKDKRSHSDSGGCQPVFPGF